MADHVTLVLTIKLGEDDRYLDHCQSAENVQSILAQEVARQPALILCEGVPGYHTLSLQRVEHVVALQGERFAEDVQHQRGRDAQVP